MPLNFPNSPSLNDFFVPGGRRWQWNGTAWQRIPDPGAQGVQGATGSTGPTGAQGAAGAQGDDANLATSTSAPGSPSAGDMWWDSDDANLYVYYNDGASSQWVSVNTGVRGAQGATGAQGANGATGAKGRT